MKIVLLGANGRTGRAVIGQALNAGDSVTALVRAEDRLADIRHERLGVRIGNACDPEVLAALMPGHDAVISALGPRRPWKAATAIYPDSASAIVAAMTGSDVKRLLVTSSALIYPADGLLVRLLKRLVENLVQQAERMEAQIRATDLDWTIVRTSFLTNKAVGPHRLGEGGLPERAGAISRASVARFLLAEAREANHVRKVVALCG